METLYHSVRYLFFAEPQNVLDLTTGTQTQTKVETGELDAKRAKFNPPRQQGYLAVENIKTVHHAPCTLKCIACDQVHENVRAYGDCQSKFIANCRKNHCVDPLANDLPPHIKADLVKNGVKFGVKETVVTIKKEPQEKVCVTVKKESAPIVPVTRPPLAKRIRAPSPPIPPAADTEDDAEFHKYFPRDSSELPLCKHKPRCHLGHLKCTPENWISSTSESENDGEDDGEKTPIEK